MKTGLVLLFICLDFLNSRIILFPTSYHTGERGVCFVNVFNCPLYQLQLHDHRITLFAALGGKETPFLS